MSQFRKKPVVIEAITFDELIQHGIDSGAPLYGGNPDLGYRHGMPWSFDYKGHAITHENDVVVLPTRL